MMKTLCVGDHSKPLVNLTAESLKAFYHYYYHCCYWEISYTSSYLCTSQKFSLICRNYKFHITNLGQEKLPSRWWTTVSATQEKESQYSWNVFKLGYNELEYFLQQLELFELEWFLKELGVYKVLKHSGYDQTAIDTLVQRIS